MKKLFKSSLIFLPILIFMFVVNIYIDPASLLNKSAEKQIAHALLSGKNVENVTNIDDRAMIEYYFEEREKPIDCLILGASRGMQISSEVTGIESTFNAGVTGAELRDMISIYYMYREKFDTPKTVILTLEPWTLSENYISKRCITEGYYKFCDEQNLIPVKTNNIKVELEKIFEMFSISYFQQSINPIFSGNFNLKKQITITDAFSGDGDIRHWDGSYTYNRKFISSSDTEKLEAINDMKEKVPSMIKDFRFGLDDQLERFIKMLKDEGSEVILFVPPIQPEYYDFIVNETPYSDCLTETSKTYKKIADENNILMIGEYVNGDLTMSDFYDVLHPTYEYVYNLFEDFRNLNVR